MKIILALSIVLLSGCAMNEYKNKISNLNSLRESGKITDDQYRWRYEMIEQQEQARKQRVLMMYSMMQGQRTTTTQQTSTFYGSDRYRVQSLGNGNYRVQQDGYTVIPAN